jgi:biotin carboxylase
LLQAPISSSQALKHIVDEDISFPFVIKPNAGINGKKVIICETEHDFDTKIVADRYFDAVKHGSRIVQKYADYTQEYGIMYVRLPGEKNGKITGIVQREFHTVVGDGIHTLEELVHDHPRARYRYSSLACYHKKRWHKVIPSGESIMLMDIGNHVRGVTFRDVSNLIT